LPQVDYIELADVFWRRDNPGRRSLATRIWLRKARCVITCYSLAVGLLTGKHRTVGRSEFIKKWQYRSQSAGDPGE